MCFKQSPRLNEFLSKLAGGTYSSAGRALSSLSATKDLSDDDRAEARKAIATHFKVEPATASETSPEAAASTEPEAPKPAHHPEVDMAILTFADVRTAQDAASAALRKAVEGPAHEYTDEELTSLFRIALELDDLGVFRSLLFRYGSRATPQIVDVERLAQHARFFTYTYSIFSVPLGNSPLVQALVNKLPPEIGRRYGDDKQVEGFNRSVRALGERFNAETFGPVVIEYATPRFVLGWLRTHARTIPEGVHQFAHRMMSLYLNGDTNAGSLLTFVETLEPDLSIIEEIIRVLLAQRQLGDALFIAKAAPATYKAQLYRLLHPMVMRHGDPVSLIIFGMIFPSDVDRAEIKSNVKAFFEPDIDARIDDLIDGVDPVDTFESVPTVLSKEAALELKSTLMAILGHPMRNEAIAADFKNATSGYESFLEGLLAKLNTASTAV